MSRRVVLLLLPLLSGCATSSGVSPAASAATGASAWTIYRSASPSPAFSGSLAPYLTVTGTLITYNPAVVPAGASVTLSIAKLGYASEVRFTVRDLVPLREYGARLDASPCPPSAGPP